MPTTTIRSRFDRCNTSAWDLITASSTAPTAASSCLCSNTSLNRGTRRLGNRSAFALGNGEMHDELVGFSGWVTAGSPRRQQNKPRAHDEAHSVHPRVHDAAGGRATTNSGTTPVDS